jgi:hypothetical protein
MRRLEVTDLLQVAGPPLLLAGLGLAHPMHLTADSAARWRDLHVALLPIFPLLALGPWTLVRGERLAVRWMAGLLGFAYAVCYTALDVLAGIAAGALKSAGAEGKWTAVVFSQADDLVIYGVWAFLVAVVLASVVALRRAGLSAAPGAVIVIAAAVSFRDSHIFWPRGGLTMIALAIGWTALLPALTQASAGAESDGRTVVS